LTLAEMAGAVFQTGGQGRDALESVEISRLAKSRIRENPINSALIVALKVANREVLRTLCAVA